MLDMVASRILLVLTQKIRWKTPGAAVIFVKFPTECGQDLPIRFDVAVSPTRQLALRPLVMVGKKKPLKQPPLTLTVNIVHACKRGSVFYHDFDRNEMKPFSRVKNILLSYYKGTV